MLLMMRGFLFESMSIVCFVLSATFSILVLYITAFGSNFILFYIVCFLKSLLLYSAVALLASEYTYLGLPLHFMILIQSIYFYVLFLFVGYRLVFGARTRIVLMLLYLISVSAGIVIFCLVLPNPAILIDL